MASSLATVESGSYDDEDEDGDECPEPSTCSELDADDDRNCDLVSDSDLDGGPLAGGPFASDRGRLGGHHGNAPFQLSRALPRLQEFSGPAGIHSGSTSGMLGLQLPAAPITHGGSISNVLGLQLPAAPGNHRDSNMLGQQLPAARGHHLGSISNILGLQLPAAPGNHRDSNMLGQQLPAARGHHLGSISNILGLQLPAAFGNYGGSTSSLIGLQPTALVGDCHGANIGNGSSGGSTRIGPYGKSNGRPVRSYL